MRNFKLIILLCLVVLFLIGCGNSTNNVKESSTKEEVELPVNEIEKSTSPEGAKTVQEEIVKEETEYIDKSLYVGVELEFVKLINLSVTYMKNGDGAAYKGLLSSDTPITTMPNRNVQKVELVAIGDVTETQAAMEINLWMDEDDTADYRMYVLRKEQNVWKIHDID